MAKKSKKTKKRYTGPTLIDRLPNNHGEWLERCIEFTERAIRTPPFKEDRFLIDQAARLRKQLEEWRKNESQN